MLSAKYIKEKPLPLLILINESKRVKDREEDEKSRRGKGNREINTFFWF